MKKIYFIPIGALVLITAYFLILVWALDDYPVAVVAYSTRPTSSHVYYLDGKPIGTAQGFCAVNRDDDWKIELKLEDATQTVTVRDNSTSRFTIDPAQGSDLGLIVVQANDNQSLREKYGCTF